MGRDYVQLAVTTYQARSSVGPKDTKKTPSCANSLTERTAVPRYANHLCSLLNAKSRVNSQRTPVPNPKHQLGFTLDRLLGFDCLPPSETSNEWNVSDPVCTVRHVENGAEFLRSAHRSRLRTIQLSIEPYFIDQPGARWNWEPIAMRKAHLIRITGVFHAIHDYFQRQPTHPERHIIKSLGNATRRL